jgi:hypothetical protein
MPLPARLCRGYGLGVKFDTYCPLCRKTLDGLLLLISTSRPFLPKITLHLLAIYRVFSKKTLQNQSKKQAKIITLANWILSKACELKRGAKTAYCV